MIGPAPTAGGILAAQVYHRKILAVLRLRPSPLSRAERRALSRRAARWLPRATGEDRRWITVGSQPGRLPRFMEYALDAPAREYVAPPVDSDLPDRRSRATVSRETDVFTFEHPSIPEEQE